MNSEEIQTVLDHLRSGDRIGAIAVLRQFTDLSLQSAADRMKELEREHGLERPYKEEDMGMDAVVIAIGTFSRDLVKHMDYAEEFYAKTRDGANVVRTVFSAITTKASCELAEAFGVEPWDFNQHHLDPMSANLEKLRIVSDDEQVESFLALRDAGFQFYYMPNG
jgi:hypothetical protein